MGKYQEAIGIWEHTIGSITHKLVPEEDDNYKFLQAKDESQKKQNGAILHKRVGEIYLDMVTRVNPALSEEDNKELKNWIGVNINKITEDFLIAFRWTTPEKLEELKKNLTDQKEPTK